MFGWLEIVLIILAILVLFGGSRLPGLSQGIGRSIKYFKYGLRGDDGIEVRPVDKKEDENEPRQNG